MHTSLRNILYTLLALSLLCTVTVGCGDDSGGGPAQSLGLGAFDEDLQAVNVFWRCEDGTYSGSGNLGGFGSKPPSEAAVFLWDIESNTLSGEVARFTVADERTEEVEFALEGFSCGELTHAVLTVSLADNAFGEPDIFTPSATESIGRGGGYFANNATGEAQIDLGLSKEVSRVTLISVSLNSGQGQSLELTSNGGNETEGYSYSGVGFFRPNIDAFAKLSVIRDGGTIVDLYAL